VTVFSKQSQHAIPPMFTDPLTGLRLPDHTYMIHLNNPENTRVFPLNPNLNRISTPPQIFHPTLSAATFPLTHNNFFKPYPGSIKAYQPLSRLKKNSPFSSLHQRLPAALQGRFCLVPLAPVSGAPQHSPPSPSACFRNPFSLSLISPVKSLKWSNLV
jgi:hypothetical protein